MSEKSVKLKVYHNVGEKTFIDTIEAESFDDFLLVSVDLNDSDLISEMGERLSEVLPDKKFIIVPKSLDISFYGVEIDNDDRPACSELQYATSSEETT